jgi:hypothetical protein
VEQAHGNDPTHLWRIPHLLSAHPEIREYASHLATIVERVWRAVMTAAAPADLERLEPIVVEMRAELVASRPTQLVQMLADQVMANWQQMRYLERIAAEPSAFGHLCSNHVVAAHRAYEAARKQLTEVRELIQNVPVPVRVFNSEPNAKPLGASPFRPCFD